MKFTTTIYLAIALAISLAGNAFLGWRLAGAKPRCEASKAVATVKADQDVQLEQGKRDTKLDAVSANTKADAKKATGKVQEQTRARTEAIERVVVRGDCARPVGLPALDAAADQARAAAGK